MLNNNELNYYNQIKDEFINNEIEKAVKDYSKNKNELKRYINVGKLLFDAQGGETRAKYGDELIKKYSALLTKECDLYVIKYSSDERIIARKFITTCN